jgi:hypothetical protein
MSARLRPFFLYFGGKYRLAPRYPRPDCARLVEPFAGAAGYSTRHYSADVHLVDADPIIAGLWAYLIRTPAAEIRALPLLGPEHSVDDLGPVPQEAKWLVGFWLNSATSHPCRTPSKWMRDGWAPGSFWGAPVRERLAWQVERIRHWRVSEGSYADVLNRTATWFIDPPYQQAGKGYRYGSSRIDFPALGVWCRGRAGQVIVCENEGADWLDFRPFHLAKATSGAGRMGKSREVIWTNRVAPSEPDLFDALVAA